MASRPDPFEPSLRTLRIARDIADKMQRAVKAEGTTTPMVDFVMAAGVLHAYVLAFAIENGSNQKDTLDVANKLVGRMTEVFVQKRTLQS